MKVPNLRCTKTERKPHRTSPAINRMNLAKKIRLCHVQLLPLMSGIQRITLQILDVLDRDRFEPHVVCQSPGPFSEEVESRGVRCHFVPNLVRPIHPLRDFLAYRDLRRLFERERFDIVHTHCSKPGIVGRIAARKAGVPCILHHVQSFAWHEFTSSPLKQAYMACERFAAPYGDRMLFVNHFDRHTAVAEGLMPEDRCPLIFNGTDLKPFQPSFERRPDSDLRRSFGLTPNGTLIFFVARLEKPKQPWLLPEIAAELDRRLPQAEWKLVVAGDGAYREAVERRIAELNVGHRMQLVGWQSEELKYRTYHEADVVLQPSLYEGLSLTLIEAQAAGLPAVAGNVKGNREVVTPGTGFLCDARSAADYAERLATLVADPQLRITQGRAARAHAELEFDVEVNMRRVTDLYETMLAEKGWLAKPTPAADKPRRAA